MNVVRLAEVEKRIAAKIAQREEINKALSFLYEQRDAIKSEPKVEPVWDAAQFNAVWLLSHERYTWQTADYVELVQAIIEAELQKQPKVSLFYVREKLKVRMPLASIFGAALEFNSRRVKNDAVNNIQVGTEVIVDLALPLLPYVMVNNWIGRTEADTRKERT